MIFFKGVVMKRGLIFIWAFIGCVCAFAQQTFTERLTEENSEQGTVNVYQSETITNLVNGIVVHQNTTDSLENVEVRSDLKLPARMLRVAGFRIQVYAGGNSRASRNEAYAIATKIKSYFNDLTAYTLFQSPRWLCRVGDFRTIEEATQMLHKVKETHEFEEATIVKSMIQIPY